MGHRVPVCPPSCQGLPAAGVPFFSPTVVPTVTELVSRTLCLDLGDCFFPFLVYYCCFGVSMFLHSRSPPLPIQVQAISFTGPGVRHLWGAGQLSPLGKELVLEDNLNFIT